MEQEDKILEENGAETAQDQPEAAEETDTAPEAPQSAESESETESPTEAEQPTAEADSDAPPEDSVEDTDEPEAETAAQESEAAEEVEAEPAEEEESPGEDEEQDAIPEAAESEVPEIQEEPTAEEEEVELVEQEDIADEEETQDAIPDAAESEAPEMQEEPAAEEKEAEEDVEPAAEEEAAEDDGTEAGEAEEADTGEEEAPVEAIAESPSDEELFLAAVSGDVESMEMTHLKRGQILTGIIATKDADEILIDVGAKSEGIIAGREMSNMSEEDLAALNEGDEIEVYVLRPENKQGHPVLSIARAKEAEDWNEAEEYLESKEIYESVIAGYNKGGLIVNFGRVRGFVPASQVSPARRRRSKGSTPSERWGTMLNEEIAVKVIEVNRKQNRLILSERAADRELREQRREELIERLEVGQVIEGTVVRLTDFGAFVDIGGADGLVHLSELAWKHITHPKEVVKVGDKIRVEVINIDPERQRIGLSRKNQLDDPWETIAEDYHPDELVQGKITKLTKFGAFARLTDQPAIEGLIHISELADRRVGHPREVVNEGDVLTLRIIRIEPERRRLGLSLKRVDSAEYIDDDWESLYQAAVSDEEDTDADEEQNEEQNEE